MIGGNFSPQLSSKKEHNKPHLFGPFDGKNFTFSVLYETLILTEVFEKSAFFQLYILTVLILLIFLLIQASRPKGKKIIHESLIHNLLIKMNQSIHQPTRYD